MYVGSKLILKKCIMKKKLPESALEEPENIARVLSICFNNTRLKQ